VLPAAAAAVLAHVLTPIHQAAAGPAAPGGVGDVAEGLPARHPHGVAAEREGDLDLPGAGLGVSQQRSAGPAGGVEGVAAGEGAGRGLGALDGCWVRSPGVCSDGDDDAAAQMD